ncbi:MAG: hypothetical protein U0Y10_07210 [Spirosomataceae bacterium]
MPILYVIAGPPGIGKSTDGGNFVPSSIETLNHDKLNTEYKNREIPDYEDRANLKANSFIKEKLSQKVDFGIELNLGSEGHYDFVRYIRQNHASYKIYVILFFTDDLLLCLDRAFLREKSGGHQVAPEIIKRMYQYTLPLFRKHIKLLDYLQFIHVDYVYAGYYPNAQKDFLHTSVPLWLINHFPEILL